jgi:hypothetical protein
MPTMVVWSGRPAAPTGPESWHSVLTGTITAPTAFSGQEGDRMTCDRLVCANCAGPVNEGRCAVCRASRERLHQQGGLQGLLAGLTPGMLIALLAVLALVALVLHHT